MRSNWKVKLRAAWRFLKPRPCSRIHTCGICGGALLTGIGHRCAPAMIRGRIYRCPHCGDALTPGIGHRCADPAADRERLIRANWSSGAGQQLRRQLQAIGIRRQRRAAAEVHAGFDLFRQLNTQRCEEIWHRIDEWSETDWLTAAAGELGEAANLIKKRRRGETIAPGEVGRELADAVTYIDLLACRLGLNLGCIVTDKFDEVSRRVGFAFRFAPAGIDGLTSVLDAYGISAGPAVPAKGGDHGRFKPDRNSGGDAGPGGDCGGDVGGPPAGSETEADGGKPAGDAAAEPAELAEPADPQPLRCDACERMFDPPVTGAACIIGDKVFCPSCAADGR